MPRAAIVLTTINDPELLDGYHENLSTYGHVDDVRVVVIPDRKTPAAAFERCETLRACGLDVSCPDVDEQEGFLRRLGFAPELVPYNSDNRRNVGFLMALEDGADFLISIDDDNWCGDEDFVSSHAVVSEESRPHEVVESASGWFNICRLLRIEPDRDVYPRGFPYFARHAEPDVAGETRDAIVRMNAGLWLQEPDLDAVTWLASPVRATDFRERSVVLGDGTWSPINTQNTALDRDVIAAYYFVRMGYSFGGLQIDRYGDIFSGYFSQVCVRHMGHAVRVGTPVAVHRRNSHDYLRDAAHELGCIWVLEDLLAWLPEQKLDGDSYAEAYVSLSHLLEDAVAGFTGPIWTEPTRAYFHKLAYCMRQWAKACERIG